MSRTLNLNPVLNLFINCISARSAPYISPTKDECTFLFLKFLINVCAILKGALSGLRQFLATESTFKMMKNGFYFISKALFVLNILKFLS